MAKKPRTRSPVKIILDSNAFFVPLHLRIDIIDSLKTLLNRRMELILLSPVQAELQRLATVGSPKERRDSAYALNLSNRCRLVRVNSEGKSTDDVIIQMADAWKCAVFTNDTNLRKKLRDINVPVVYVRQKSRLEIDGSI